MVPAAQALQVVVEFPILIPQLTSSFSVAFVCQIAIVPLAVILICSALFVQKDISEASLLVRETPVPV